MIFFREFKKRSEFRGHSTECGGVGAVTCVTCGTLNRFGWDSRVPRGLATNTSRVSSPLFPLSLFVAVRLSGGNLREGLGSVVGRSPAGVGKECPNQPCRARLRRVRSSSIWPSRTTLSFGAMASIATRSYTTDFRPGMTWRNIWKMSSTGKVASVIPLGS